MYLVLVVLSSITILIIWLSSPDHGGQRNLIYFGEGTRTGYQIEINLLLLLLASIAHMLNSLCTQLDHSEAVYTQLPHKQFGSHCNMAPANLKSPSILRRQPWLGKVSMLPSARCEHAVHAGWSEEVWDGSAAEVTASAGRVAEAAAQLKLSDWETGICVAHATAERMATLVTSIAAGRECAEVRRSQ